MGNNIITVTLIPTTRKVLLEQAQGQQISIERHAGEILARHVQRPEWHEVAADSDRAALAAEVERLTGERDRAREAAIRLWASMRDERPEQQPHAPVSLREVLDGTGEVLQLAVDMMRARSAQRPTAELMSGSVSIDVSSSAPAPGDVHTVIDGSRWVVVAAAGEQLELEFMGTSEPRSWFTSAPRLMAQTITRRRAR